MTRLIKWARKRYAEIREIKRERARHKRISAQLRQELWKWLLMNPDKHKSEWPRWRFNGGPIPKEKYFWDVAEQGVLEKQDQEYRAHKERFLYVEENEKGLHLKDGYLGIRELPKYGRARWVVLSLRDRNNQYKLGELIEKTGRSEKELKRLILDVSVVSGMSYGYVLDALLQLMDWKKKND